MIILHRIVRLIVLAALVSAGVVLVLAGVSETVWQTLADMFQATRRLLLSTGLATLLLALLFLLTGMRRKRRGQFLSFANEGGRVSISTDAIADYLAKMASEFPAILRLKPVVVPRKNTVDIVAEVRVRAGPDIHEVCQVLQRRIREDMINGLGITEVGQVEVTVSHIHASQRPD